MYVRAECSGLYRSPICSGTTHKAFVNDAAADKMDNQRTFSARRVMTTCNLPFPDFLQLPLIEHQSRGLEFPPYGRGQKVETYIAQADGRGEEEKRHDERNNEQ